MIEITTGVAFLMTSVYGAGNVNGQVNTAPVAQKVDTAISQQIDTAISDKDIESYVRSEYKNTPILVDIARCESHYHQFDASGNVVRGIVNNADVGIMQINEKYHGDTAKKLGIDIYTTEGNVAYAKYLYGKFGSEPWKSSQPCWGSNSVAMNNK